MAHSAHCFHDLSIAAATFAALAITACGSSAPDPLIQNCSLHVTLGAQPIGTAPCIARASSGSANTVNLVLNGPSDSISLVQFHIFLPFAPEPRLYEIQSTHRYDVRVGTRDGKFWRLEAPDQAPMRLDLSQLVVLPTAATTGTDVAYVVHGSLSIELPPVSTSGASGNVTISAEF